MHRDFRRATLTAGNSTVKCRGGFLPSPNALLLYFHKHHGFRSISALFFYNFTASEKTVESRTFVFINMTGYTFILGPPFFLALPPGATMATLLFSMPWFFIEFIVLTPIQR